MSLTLNFIGGAERLILDAALALQEKGHRVTLYTSHHSKDHCFSESSNINVVVKGDFLPRHLFGMFHLFFATLRSFYLAIWLFFMAPNNFDVILSDQISFSIPVLRKCADKVVFYCHFPDKLLAPKGKRNWLRLLYRYYFDRYEEATIRVADKVLVNSEFTAGIFAEAFRSIKRTPEVLHPAINRQTFDRLWDPSCSLSKELQSLCDSGKKIILSINRFERKKNIRLAIDSFAWLRDRLNGDEHRNVHNVHLVLAGGYDKRVTENREHLEELQLYCTALGLDHQTFFPDNHRTFTASADVTFMPSISDDQKNYLLHASTCLLYTPSFEHFGIVPVEAMYCGLPVVSVNNGGPKETVVNGQTGFLCEPTANAFGTAILKLVSDQVIRLQLSKAAKQRVLDRFEFAAFASKLDDIVTAVHDSRRINN